ncbi:MAG: PilZ domain-containing protein [Nitrospira sp.]|nr:PilZ domain-containing protein [Nitrospira sp.]
MTSSENNPNAPQPRGRPRISVDYPAVVTSEGRIAQGIVMNLTITGCEVESPGQFPIGVHVSLRLNPPSARPPITIALAIVRWQEEDRFGLEFVRFEGHAKEQLEDMLNQRESSSTD